MTATDPTYLGRVSSVSGSTISVRLAESLSSGLAMIDGHTYRVGQVGSFVRIPLGYQDLYGVVSEIGAAAIPESITVQDLNAQDTGRWMRVELAGEATGEHFERGLSQHPNVDDAVHLVTQKDLRRIYGGVEDDQVEIGTLASAENIIVRLSLDALVTRHSAIVGSTGSGKSTTVASILRSIVRSSESVASSGARILLLDVHGEYSAALGDLAKTFSATPSPGEEPLFVPYWALEAEELLDFVAGSLGDNHLMAFADKIQELKQIRLSAGELPGLDPQSLTVDSPVPFSLKKLWYDLIDFETATFTGPQRDQPALEDAGDAATLAAPRYTPHAMGAAGPFLNQAAKGIRRPLNLLRSRLLDRRYDFILHPGPWEPNIAGHTAQDLDTLLAGWLGHDRPITILDLSGVPSSVLVRLIGSILRVVYEALYWSREKTEGGVLRPLLVVMEEAHRYVSPDSGNVAADIVKRIAKEGRKYGVGAMLVSQRPAEIDETVLSQCGTLIALRLSNPADRGRVKGALPDNLSGLMDLLPVLRTGEAIICGEAARLPVRCRISLPPADRLPRSSDPEVSVAWRTRRVAEGYDRMVASWRAQRTTAIVQGVTITRTPVSEDEQ
jgi:DNA helicase HerA-like ATPase